MSSTISPNMGLIVPGVGTEPGPTWASDLNSSLGSIDQHNHSAGQGVQITPTGININTDLSINANNLTMVKTVNFTAQLSSIPGTSPNLGCVYVAGNELYYNDEAGNVVQITNTGSVNAGAGSITGLPSGTASATYSSGSKTFIWQSSTSTAANLDAGSVILREVVPSANGVTLSSPTSLAADYTLIMPLVPAVTSFVTLDNSGNMGSNIPVLGALTGANLVPTQTIAQTQIVSYAAQQISTSSGNFTNGTGSLTDVTNLSVNITTQGGAVFLGLQPDSSGNANLIVANGGSPVTFMLRVIRDSTTVTNSMTFFNPTSGFNLSQTCGIFFGLDPVAAGTYNYKVQVQLTSGTGNITIGYLQLVAYEI